MKGPCAVNLHNAVTVSQQRLGRRVAHLASPRMKELCAALRLPWVAMGTNIPRLGYLTVQTGPGFAKSLLLATLCLCCSEASAQADDKEPAAVIELGGAASRNLKDGGSSFGADIAVEVTPIENWPELEAGTTPLFRRHSTEWDTDLLFKKPWTLSKKVEFMLGVGPEWIHTRAYRVTTNSLGGEAVLDFMFWPSAEYRLGWYLEPGYEYNFGRGHERSVGVSGGLLIAIPQIRSLFGKR
jgi:hypothetical protein